MSVRVKLDPPRVRLFSGLALMLRDMGISAVNVLRRVGLPDDRLARPHELVDRATYVALWRAIEAEANDPLLPLRFGRGVRIETFDPLLFAALCSSNAGEAVTRIARYKDIQGMPRLVTARAGGRVRVEAVWPGDLGPAPGTLILTEFVFLLSFFRTATREELRPSGVELRDARPLPREFDEFFGCPIERGAARDAAVFSDAVMSRAFLTANAATLAWFEPALRPRLGELATEASLTERVRAALLEALPGNRPSVQAVGARLGLSARTVQRRLLDEGTTFQSVLDATRRELADWYLATTTLPHTEIAYLLGFEEPNSFHRAYRAWTGTTPEQRRVAGLAKTS